MQKVQAIFVRPICACHKKNPVLFCLFALLFVSLPTIKPVLPWTGRVNNNIDGILRPTMPFVGQAKGKGIYGRYHSVTSNFATLILRIK